MVSTGCCDKIKLDDILPILSAKEYAGSEGPYFFSRTLLRTDLAICIAAAMLAGPPYGFLDRIRPTVRKTVSQKPSRFTSASLFLA